LYGLTEEIKGGGREWVKLKNSKAKEEDIVYTTGKTSKKGVSPWTPSAYFSAISSYYNYLVYKCALDTKPILSLRKRNQANNRPKTNGSSLINRDWTNNIPLEV
jgi:site-specific recombinase XerC